MINSNIGKTIKIERAKRKMQAKELAKKAGISGPYLSDIENEKTTPSIKALCKISLALGITAEDLLLEAIKYKEAGNNE